MPSNRKTVRRFKRSTPRVATTSSTALRYSVANQNKRYPKMKSIAHAGRIARITGGDESSSEMNPSTKFNGLDLKIKRSPFRGYIMSDLRYSNSVFLAAPGTTTTFGTEQIWSLNSLFKPNFTASGHQPYTYDQITAIYQRYRVFQVSIELLYIGPTDYTISVGAMPQSSANTYAIGGTSWDPSAEKDGFFGIRGVNTSSGTNSNRLHFTTNIWDLEGLSYQQWISDDGYDANVGSSPAKQPLLRTAALNWLGDAASKTVLHTVNICYHARFHLPVTANQS